MEKIEKKIFDQVVSDSIVIEAIEFKKGEVRTKLSQFYGPVFQSKSELKLNHEQVLAIEKIKKGIDFFKEMNLPDERELELEFEVKRQDEIVRLGARFDSLEEEELKNRVFKKPSIEKIQLNKIELKEIPNLEVEVFILHFDSPNKITLLRDDDSLSLLVRGVKEDHPNFAQYSEFLEWIMKLFEASKQHYHDTMEERRLKFQKRLRDYTLQASQGKLFPDLNDFDKSFLEKKVRKLNEQFMNEKMNELGLAGSVTVRQN